MDSTFEYFGLKTTSEEDYELLAAVEDWIYYSLSGDEINTITDEEYVGLVVDMFKILVKPPYHGKRRNRPKNTVLKVEATFQLSKDAKHVILDEEYGIKSVEEAVAIVEHLYAGAVDIKIIVDGKVYDSMNEEFDNWREVDSFYDEPLYDNGDLNCVSIFRDKFNLPEDFHDGMKLGEFCELCKDFEIAVYNNEEMNINGVESDKKVMAYSGHVVDGWVDKILIPRNELVQDLDERFSECLKNKDEVIHNIKVYDGVWGRWLSSFVVHGVKYIRDFLHPVKIMSDLMEKYSSAFFHPFVANCAVYSGVAIDQAGYDMNGAYVSALLKVDKFPIIDNIPMNYKRFKSSIFKSHDAVVLADEFVYKGIKFPATFWYLKDAERLGLDIKEVHLITGYKDFDKDEFIHCLDDYVKPDDKAFLHVEEAKKGDNIVENKWVEGRNRFFELVVKRFLGCCVASNIKKREKVYTAYLDDLMNSDLPHTITREKDDFSLCKRLMNNIYFAMMSNYHLRLLELIDKYEPKAVFCDCIYVSPDVEINEPDMKFESFVEERHCAKEYPKYELMVRYVVGPAGSGKTYKLAHQLSTKSSLVVVPEMRLSEAWPGFKVSNPNYLLNRHSLPNVDDIVFDECFKIDTEQLNVLLGYALHNRIRIWCSGDIYQLRQVNSDVLALRCELINAYDILHGNFRNNFDYKALGLTSPKPLPIAELKNLYDTYLRSHATDKPVFDKIMYCYRTSEHSTREKYEKLYQQYVARNKHPHDIIYVRCNKNCVIKHKQYFNGVIYKVPLYFAINNKSHFIISNVYSLYATQGQSIKSDDFILIADDEKYYYNNQRMLYVLISRLTLH